MTTIDLSTKVVDGGFFLLKDVRPAPFDWSTDRGATEHFLGTFRDSGAPVREALLDMVRSAKKQVFIVSFMLGDDQLIDELIAAADRLRGGVYVITALDERSLGRGLREYEENEQESPEERRKNFERLTSRGIYVRGHESCHSKYAVVDDRIAVVGSANFVTQGFTWTGEANILLRDPLQVRQLKRLFAELWYEGCTWEVPPGEMYLVAERTANEPPTRPHPPSGQNGEVVWTNGPQHLSLLKVIQDTVRTAQEQLTLSTYSIVGMSQKPHLVLDDLHDALRRGVGVRMFVRQRNAWPEQMAELVTLHDAGVEVVGDLRNHAKVVIADGKKAVVFSANLDGKHGLDSGVETGIQVSDPTCLRELIRYMDHVIANADTHFVRDPMLKELDGRLAARWCNRWPWPDVVSVNCSAEFGNCFASAADSGPVLYEQDQDELRLYVGKLRFDIDIKQSEWSGRMTEVPEAMTAAKRLGEWLQSVRRQYDGAKRVQRGFCPATVRLHGLGV